ncbi:zinc ribbon domain-containing protein [Streptomyces sp. NPDC005728]|uniref:zinc ribbon domain-containing protein n=1 Tax=Streptomyces sp. NPDC005728 TaxID=3157054 RepID=UPI0033E34913
MSPGRMLMSAADTAYTSQRCHACGFVTEDNRESQSVFVCKNPGCGNTDHADVNAAKNIKTAGQAASACGDLDTSRSVQQEPGMGNRPAPRIGGIPGLQPGEEVNSSSRQRRRQNHTPACTLRPRKVARPVMSPS